MERFLLKRHQATLSSRISNDCLEQMLLSLTLEPPCSGLLTIPRSNLVSRELRALTTGPRNLPLISNLESFARLAQTWQLALLFQCAMGRRPVFSLQISMVEREAVFHSC